MSRIRLAVFALIALTALLTAAPAHAHRGSVPDPAAVVAVDSVPAAPPVPAAAPAAFRAQPSRLSWIAGPVAWSGLPWVPLAVLAGVAALAARRRPRAGIALGLALLVGVLTFESGVHSVHHLGEPAHASACGVASTSSNLAGLAVEPGVTLSAPAPLGTAVALATPLDTCALPASPHEGRAPPGIS